MAASAQPPAQATANEAPEAALARRSLIELVASQGLAVCGDPWRCEALLRDRCGGSRREIFWLMAALKENIVADLKTGLQIGLRQTPEAVLVARLTHKLSEGLGLTAEAAQWAVSVWLEAVRQAPASTPTPEMPEVRPALPEWPDPDAVAGESVALPVGWDGRWLGLCLAGLVVSGAALAAIGWAAFYAGAGTPRGWLIETGALAVGLGLCALAEYGLARAFAVWGLRWRPEAGRAAWALAPEVLLLIAQPVVLVAGPLVWAGGWLGAGRYYGPPVDFAFHLGRLVQTILVGAFLWYWADWMTRLQGRVAVTLVRR